MRDVARRARPPPARPPGCRTQYPEPANGKQAVGGKVEGSQRFVRPSIAFELVGGRAGCPRGKGKSVKVALTACPRQLLTILNAMLRDGAAWDASAALAA